MIWQERLTFRRHIGLQACALRALYAAVGAFVTRALIISTILWRHMLASATLPLFLLGILLILCALVFQLLELQHSNQTIYVEISDLTESCGLSKVGRTHEFSRKSM